jgi:hypothetical protein
MTTRHLLPLTHVLLTLSVTDETRTPIGPIVDAHLNSVTEVYPPDHDPVWITPRTCQTPTGDALLFLLSAAEVGLDGGCPDGIPPHVYAAAVDLLTALRADTLAVVDHL